MVADPVGIDPDPTCKKINEYDFDRKNPYQDPDTVFQSHLDPDPQPWLTEQRDLV